MRRLIEVRELTKVYGSGKGVFDLSFHVEEGEIFGYLGPNGSGKTTTIRHLLGFLRPEKGACFINRLDCRQEAAAIQRSLGYLPGEIAFFDDMTGDQFLNLMGEMRAMKNGKRRQALIERFDLTPNVRIRRMSKGMKQKLGLVAAFMHDPSVYVLDEPTSGLDPLMQNAFVDLILEEKGRGKTVLMSSHSFEEIDRTCDRAGIIRAGRLVAVEDIHALKAAQQKAYVVTVASDEDVALLKESGLEVTDAGHHRVTVLVRGELTGFIATLARCRVLGLDVSAQNLEQVFMQYYGQEAASS